MSSSYPGDAPRPGDEPGPGTENQDAHDPGLPDQGTGATAQGPSAQDQPGYWERMAADQAREQEQQGHPSTEETGPITPSGPVFNPTSAEPTSSYGQGPQQPGPSGASAPPPPPGGPQGYPPAQGYPPPYAQQPGQPYDQPYGQPYGQAYGQAPQQPYQQPYGQPYQQGYPPAYPYTGARPMQSQANLAMALGIGGLVVGLFLSCGLGLLASPFAWSMGRRSLRDIEDSRGELDGETQARIGMVTGIIGTVLLGLVLVALVGLAVVLIAAGATTSA